MIVKASYLLPRKGSSNVNLVLAKGPVLNFYHKNGAIVNAANTLCLGGGGVDGAISEAGGETLYQDREKLPMISLGMRCMVGDAVITGPNDYGSIGTPYVIHAVGPNFLEYDYKKYEKPDQLLSSAYKKTLERAKEAKLEAVAYSLISAGIYKGMKTRHDVLKIGMKAIAEYISSDECYDELTDVYMFGYAQIEIDTLLEIAEELQLEKAATADKVEENE